MSNNRYYYDHEKAYQGIRKRGEVGWQAKTQFRDHAYEAKLTELITKHMPDRKGKRALDLGTGSGPTAHMLHDLGFEVTGIDISPSAIELANEMKIKHNKPDINFIVGDVLQLEAQNEKFDFVYDSHCFHCIVLDEDRKKAFTAVRNILTPIGLFLLDTMAYKETADICANPAPLRFDDDYILWHRTKEKYAGVTEYENELWCPQRRIFPPEKIKLETEYVSLKFLESISEIQSTTEPLLYRCIFRNSKVSQTHP